MPLQRGSSPKVVSHNISELTHNGSRPRSHKQIVAIALSEADKTRQRRASGGSLSTSVPFYTRNQARELHDTPHFGGLFKSDVAGRTDRLPHTVAADSFVVPASEVASLGQGNTLSGAKLMDGIISGLTGPYGAKIRHPKGFTAPKSITPKFRADGGDTGTSKVMVAGGEYLIPRDKLVEIGRRLRAAGKSKCRTDIAAGHEWARGFVLNIRKKEIKWLKNAPLPKK